MNKKISWLAGILGAQVFLTMLVFALGQSSSAPDSQPLVSVDEMALSKVVVSDGQESTVLERLNGSWQLPALHNLPANPQKVENLLAQLKQLKTQWPVSSTASSHIRFEVAKDKFKKRVSLYNGEKLIAELYVGTSPGFKKSHVRKGDKDEVYALTINAYDLANKANDWLDKSLLAVKNVSSIETDSYKLDYNKQENSWGFVGSGNGQSVDLTKAEALSKAFETLSVVALADQALTFDDGQWYEIQVAADQSWHYQFQELEGKYYVKRNDLVPVFTLAQSDYERLTSPNLESLSVPPTAGQQDGKVEGSE